MAHSRLIFWSALLFAAVGIVADGWALFFRPVGVQVLESQGNVAVQIFGLGTVEARVVSRVGFKVAGVLAELKTDHGDRVAKGAVLARLDTREQSARVGRANANIDQAVANLNRALAGVAKAEANYANARSINDRRQALVKTSNVSIELAETAKAALDIASADLTLARSDVEVARAAIKDVRAQEQLESVTLDLHTLAAPFDAVVIARRKEPGTVLAPGEPVFTLVDPGTVWVLAYIDESKAGEIQVGQPVEIVLRSLPAQRFHGRVARIEIESDRVNEERRSRSLSTDSRRLPSRRAGRGLHHHDHAPACPARAGSRHREPRARSRNRVDRRGRTARPPPGDPRPSHARRTDRNRRRRPGRRARVVAAPGRRIARGPGGAVAEIGGPMNLAFRDIRHKLLRFVLTCFGLSLLLGIVMTMTGIYRGAARRCA